MKKNSLLKKEKKTLKESLSVFLQNKKMDEKEQQNILETKDEMEKAVNSYKSMMEIHNILIDVYNKIIKLSEKKN